MKTCLLSLLLITLFVFTGFAQVSDDDRKRLADQFPTIEGWRKSDARTYGDVRLGYSVTYSSSSGGRLTVFIYNRGLQSIPDGVRNEAVGTEIINAKNEIRVAVQRKAYENATFDRFTYESYGENGKQTQMARLYSTLQIQGRKADADIIIFGKQNHFFKIRATRAKAIEGFKNKAFEAAMKKLGALFAEKRFLLLVPPPKTEGATNDSTK